MENENTKILKELEANSEMGLIQSQKMIEAFTDLEPIFEGILIKLDELPSKIEQPAISNNEEVIRLLSESIAQNKEPIDISIKLNLV